MGHPETGTQKCLLLEESTETLKVCILEEELGQGNVLRPTLCDPMSCSPPGSGQQLCQRNESLTAKFLPVGTDKGGRH